MKTLIEIAKETGAYIIDRDTSMAEIESEIVFTEAQLEATFDAYCQQFEPIYQIIYSDGLIQDVTKIHYDAIDAIKRIVYLAPQIPGDILNQVIDVLQDKISSTSTTPISDAIVEIQALAFKPDSLKD